jgi:hypothetical protein
MHVYACSCNYQFTLHGHSLIVKVFIRLCSLAQFAAIWKSANRERAKTNALEPGSLGQLSFFTPNNL